MMPVEKIRVARLALLVEECGGVGRLADAVDKSPSQISQWINSSPDSRTKKPRSISNQSARELERKRGKPDGWMDQSLDDALSNDPAQQPANTPTKDPFIVAILADLAKALSPNERQTLERHLLAESSKWLLERQDKSVSAKPIPRPDPKAQASS